MRHLSSLSALVAILSIALGLASPAVAAPCQPPQAPETLSEQVDAAFGDYLVTPLGTVMFFDVAFWDDTLPLGTLPPTATPSAEDAVKERSPEVVGYDPEKGYAWKCRSPARVRDLTPVLGDGATVKKGILELSLSESDGKLVGSWLDTPVDVQAMGILPDEGEDPAAPRPGTVVPEGTEGARELAQVSVEAIAPFPVVVDLTEGVIRAGSIELPWSDLSLAPGDTVVHDGQTWELAALAGSRAGLRSVEAEYDPTPLPNPAQTSLPLVVVWLVLGAIFFTFRYLFINVRGFWHAILVTMGRYDNEDDEGEVSHFQALSSALSATVGLGNIAGVAVAVSTGGPGAVVWMVIAALFGMSSKFAEVTLGQMYRVVKPDGTVSGGPMHYLSKGLREMKLGWLGTGLAVLFSVMAIGGSLGGGNMFQGNQSFQAIADVAPLLRPAATGSVVFERLPGEEGAIDIPALTAVGVPGGAVFVTQEPVAIPADGPRSPAVLVHAARGGYAGNVEAGAISEIAGQADAQKRVTESDLDDRVTVTNPAGTDGGGSYGLFYGIILTVVVGLVIVGGIKRIGATAGFIVPAMGVLYVLAGLGIIVMSSISDPGSVLEAIGTLFTSAFSLEAGVGGLLGVLITGFQRASFSNEAGVGSASIAHSAAATNEPVREGIVALLEPFIDTVIVCTITGVVVVVTGAYQIAGADGISMTSAAFETGLPGARYVLALAVTLFAFSTMISWSYYGDRAATWLLGDWASLPYKGLFLVCVLLGPVFTLGNVINFSDLMVLGMAFPNILGLYFLSNKVGRALRAYMKKLRKGEFEG